MQPKTLTWILAAAAVAPVILFGCATAPSDTETSAKAAAMMKSSFREQGQAKLDRLAQDDMQKTCSEYAGKTLPKDVAGRIEKANLAAIKWPADGKLVGDWKNGERIAQEGRGMQYSDDPKQPAGANCYACHQLAPQELSFGTIGPSLYQFGKQRGYTDEMRKYAYGKIYNAEAYSACTNMPRFGHKGILTEKQITDVVALLMDPASPVNK
ncbi:MAG TPA: sulfur oxidation c-type cytochrome SoxX [Casimicrobiaceae bacterium]|nr:sulfur oxidation c-type cytochrome SoxX [Casimicrobiaceae bacterium]